MRALALLTTWCLMTSAAVRAGEPGFGGAPTSDAPAASPPRARAPATKPPAGDCVVQGDDGRWMSCAALLEQREAERARKKAEREAAAPPPPPKPSAPDAGPTPGSFEWYAERAQRPPDRAPTPLEAQLKASGVDWSRYPLLQLRVDVSVKKQALDAIADLDISPQRREQVTDDHAEARVVLDEVELIAIGRMNACMRMHRVKRPPIRTVRMTPGGPIRLTVDEIVAQMPRVDPQQCQRELLVDDEIIARVRRGFALKQQLETSDFRYDELPQRDALDAELKALQKSITDEKAGGYYYLREQLPKAAPDDVDAGVP